jgi:peptidoglycan/LPS O-acetylase OafA/YrhL
MHLGPGRSSDHSLRQYQGIAFTGNHITPMTRPYDLLATGRNSHANHFNLLRLIFASLVILSHAYELKDGNRSRELLTRVFGTISFGELAVYGFFILSGYLITKSWDSQPFWTGFLVKRIARIYPAFIACSLLCGLVIAPLASSTGGYFGQLNWLQFIQGILTLQRPAIPSTFQSLHYPLVNGAMWSISYEFMCYLLIMALGLLGAIQHKTRWLLMAGAILALFTYRRLGYELQLGHLHLALNNPIIMLSILFMAGSGFYLFRSRISYNSVGLILATVGLAVCLFFENLVGLSVATCGAYLLFFTAFKPSRILNRLQPNTDVSYGVYLYGWPVQQILLNCLPDHPPLLSAALTLMLCIVLGLISWKLIEKPTIDRARLILQSRIKGHQKIKPNLL